MTKEEMVCLDCGSDENVTFGPDPYMKDIWGDDTPVWMCSNCRYESARDI